MNPEDLDPQKLAELLKKLGLTDDIDGGRNPRYEGKNMDDHEFWKTQPVSRHDEDVTETGPIEIKTVDDVSKDPVPLPEGFVWHTVNFDIQEDLDAIYHLLTNNYVEDDDCTFRFDYSRDFLKWALTPPGYEREWLISIKKESTGETVGFISGIPADIVIKGKTVRSAEINFLCTHKNLRSKRHAPILIQEVTRRVNLCDIWQAAYTAGVVLPKPVSVATYYHRSLNPKKLVEIGFSGRPANMTMAMMQKSLRVPEAVEYRNLREMTEDDAYQVCDLLNKHQAKFDLYQKFSVAEFRHFFTPRDKIIYSYVMTDDDDRITDFISFYSLPSSIFGCKNHKTLHAAYSYYNVATSVPFTSLMKQALILAKRNRFDVFNALELMNNEPIWNELKFMRGDGNLHYYLYNYKVPEFESDKLGLVLM